MTGVEELLRRTAAAQVRASDPQASAWVSANAGAGKTHVLKMRVLRLLLSGADPGRLLCLTYTKVAAAEMADRVLAELAEWTALDEVALGGRLAELLERPPTASEAGAARQLFARAIETPGGLKVQTIHAFAERLLQRFPIEAGVPPGFRILEEDQRAQLLGEAIDAVLAQAMQDGDGPLGEALARVVAHAQDERFDELIRIAVAQPAWIVSLEHFAEGSEHGDAATALDEICRRALGVAQEATIEGIEAAMADVLPSAALGQAASALLEGSKTDVVTGNLLAAAASAAGAGERRRLLAEAFLTTNGTPRKSMATKGTAAAFPGLLDMLTAAQQRFLALGEQLAALRMIEASVAVFILARAVLVGLRTLKAQRAALDFDDLIERTVSLLSASEAAEWVLYKLDGGLDHILVDEAQDTSPQQWRIVEALAREFFAGEAERVRTLFAVGDEKQSIYSFQGAAPHMFAENGRLFAELARGTGRRWTEVPLELSFRTVPPVLEAVDRTFGNGERTPGLTAEGHRVRHLARRAGQAGLVEIWPAEQWQEGQPADAFEPLSETGTTSPVTRLCDRIAATIRRWIDDKEPLHAQGRPIAPGDILILLRKRQPLAGAMIGALKSYRIPVAGADRMDISTQIAVQDAVALAEFLLLPENDLALAAVLKSPFIGLDDEALIEIAPRRKGTLWSALIDSGRTNGAMAAAVETLRRWRARADFAPPYEFLAGILDDVEIRRRMLTRLGPEAAEAIDELLNLALAYDDDKPPSLQGFLAAVTSAEREVRRDMEQGRDEVRVMTIHGAKGLEAPIVFLPDTCSRAGGKRSLRLVALDGPGLPDGLEPPRLWPVRGSSRITAIQRAESEISRLEREEFHRLLYVAMTRARDRLYIAGAEGRQRRPAGCWYEIVSEALKDLVHPVRIDVERTVLRYEAAQQATPDGKAAAGALEVPAGDLPEWARKKPPREQQLTIPLAPSRLAPLETDEAGDPVARSGRPVPPPAAPGVVEPAAAPPQALVADGRFLRGLVTHRLLQHLPELAEREWDGAAALLVERHAAGLSSRQRNAIVRETLMVLGDPAFAAVFGPGSRAEVAIAAEIRPPADGLPPLKVSGQIDRLVRLPHEVLIVDYKTNRPAPLTAEQTPLAYLLQLAAYRLVVGQIFDGLPVRAAILWTELPRLVSIPAALLDEAEPKLWRTPPSS